ncbi:MAG: hypothetical protein IJ175_00730 [Clostridia bacterium]|nr:hypothetical protein [Clostridia bacterium]
MKNTVITKLVAIILLVAISLSCTSIASAQSGSEYYSKTIKNLNLTSSKMTNSKANRITMAALMLLETIIKASDGMTMYDKVKATGTCYIARYGSCVDVYYPVGNSRYLNLFLTPSNGKIKDYGYVSYHGASSEYTYYKINMSDVWSDFSDLFNTLYD